MKGINVGHGAGEDARRDAGGVGSAVAGRHFINAAAAAD